MKGKFIVLEGIDGSGKTTQAKMLEERLAALGIKTYLTCEPSKGDVGRLLRSCLTGEKNLDERAIAGLFMTDRLDHITSEDGLIAHLEKGETVICDRYYLSSFAYNSMSAPFDWVMDINSQARALLKPDLTVFLDMQPEKFNARLEARQSTKERYEDVSLLTLARNNYYKAMDRLKDENIAIVDGMRTKEEVSESIWAAVKPLLNI